MTLAVGTIRVLHSRGVLVTITRKSDGPDTNADYLVTDPSGATMLANERELIKPLDVAPFYEYGSATQFLTKDVASAIAAPTKLSGTAAARFTMESGVVPPGMALVGATGAFAGTPTTRDQTGVTLVVAAEHSVGRTELSGILVKVGNGPTLSYVTPQALTKDVAMSNLDPTFTGDGTAAYAVKAGSDALPTGLSINATTGRISGTPTDNAETGRVTTIRVTTAYGVADKAITFNIAGA